MEEDNKYFIPTIEDFYVGYEFEFQGIPKGWHKMVFSVEDNLKTFKYNIEHGYIRVPYLSKEQIEAEGWKYFSKYGKEQEDKFHYNTFEKPNALYITYYYNSHTLTIHSDLYGDDQVFFDGECKSINEFRYICRLLNIK